jgi:formylglycine-generating enzyme required for sulfatase activity
MKPVVLHSRPKKKKRRFLKGALVVFFASTLTIVSLHASDTFRIPGRGLLAGVGGSEPQGPCPEEMVYIPAMGGGFCIDRYEVSAGKACPNTAPSNQFETQDNLRSPVCFPASLKDGTPWVNVPLHEALALCAKVGKRLPSNGEWYRAALGTPEEVDRSGAGCVLGRAGDSSAALTGTHAQCVSSYGAYDMVGNVWEWVDGSILDGQYLGRVLPSEGFVAEADADGVVAAVSTSSLSSFGGDYFYIDHVGTKGIFRGGFWNMTEKAGVFTMNAANPTTFIGTAVGFRCAREAR